MSSAETIRVECYAGHRGEQTPRRFVIDQRPVEVVEIVDCWLAPEHRYFKVTGDDGFTYLLRHDVDQQVWSLSGAPHPTGKLPPLPVS